MKPTDQDSTKLRQIAESQLACAPDFAAPTLSDSELLHELRVHQIELEMQNEELRRVQVELEESRDSYVDLYDYAPVGYLTLNHEGIIEKINLTGATWLGVERHKLGLLRYRFDAFISETDCERWHLYFLNVLKCDATPVCELALRHGDGSLFYARLDCLHVKGKESVVRIILTDITERKQVEQKIRDSLAEKEVMMREIHHRVKNNMQMMSALLELQSGYVKDEQVQRFFKDSQQRIQSMAMIHEQLYHNDNLSMIDFAACLHSLVDNLRGQFIERCSRVSIRIDAQGCTLPVDVAIPLGLC